MKKYIIFTLMMMWLSNVVFAQYQTGHQDVTLYEMQGYNHGDMPHPAYHILKETIKRLCH